MSELHEAAIEWTGQAELAPLFLEAAQRSKVETSLVYQGDEVHMTVKIQMENLQLLRDCIDALLIEFADIEEGN
tara:strand:+ start:4703 stop:4924 length:222 start_codon:yes stop_codon:yes gene_type:complete